MSCCVCMAVSFLLPPLLLISSSSSLSSQMWHINKKVMVPSHMFNVMPNGGMVIPCLLTDHLHNDKKFTGILKFFFLKRVSNCHCCNQVLREFNPPEGNVNEEMDASGDMDVLVVMDLRIDTELQESWLAREIVSRYESGKIQCATHIGMSLSTGLE